MPLLTNGADFYEEEDDLLVTVRQPLITSDDHKELEDGKFPKARQVLAILGFSGFAIVYAMRVNLSISVVSMVNHSVDTNQSLNDVCPIPISTNSSIPAVSMQKSFIFNFLTFDLLERRRVSLGRIFARNRFRFLFLWICADSNPRRTIGRNVRRKACIWNWSLPYSNFHSIDSNSSTKKSTSPCTCKDIRRNWGGSNISFNARNVSSLGAQNGKV